MRSCEQAPRLILTVKVVEVDDKHPLTRHTCSGPTVDISKEAPAVSPRDGQPSDESSRKKGGKSKRKAREVHEDTLLWAKLKAGTQFTRNKRQDERLRQRKENAASEYEGCEALDERKIKCFCGTVFTINKTNTIKDVGRAYVRKPTTIDRNGKWSPKIYKHIGPISSKSERLQQQQSAYLLLQRSD